MDERDNVARIMQHGHKKRKRKGPIKAKGKEKITIHDMKEEHDEMKSDDLTETINTIKPSNIAGKPKKSTKKRADQKENPFFDKKDDLDIDLDFDMDPLEARIQAKWINKTKNLTDEINTNTASGKFERNSILCRSENINFIMF